MKIEIKDLADFAENNPDYIFQNWNVWPDGEKETDAFYNWVHGELDDDAKEQYKNTKKLYGFLISPSEKFPGKITGGKVYPFFLCDDGDTYGDNGCSRISLNCKEKFNADCPRRIFDDIKHAVEETKRYYYSKVNFNNFQLFTTKEEAAAALKVATAQALDSQKEERRKYLLSKIETCKEELAYWKKELEALS